MWRGAFHLGFVVLCRLTKTEEKRAKTWVDKWCFSTNSHFSIFCQDSCLRNSHDAPKHMTSARFCVSFPLGVWIWRSVQCVVWVHCHAVKKQPFENMVNTPPLLPLSGSWQIVGGANGKAPAPVPLVHHTNVKAPSMLQLRVAMTRPPCHSPPLSELMGRPQTRKTDGGKRQMPGGTEQPPSSGNPSSNHTPTGCIYRKQTGRWIHSKHQRCAGLSPPF